MVDREVDIPKVSAVQLNLKDPETNLLVERLANVTGHSKARVVKDAVRARLVEVEAAREVDMAARLARVLELAALMRAKMPKPLPTQKEMDDWMYDENGLPH